MRKNYWLFKKNQWFFERIISGILPATLNGYKIKKKVFPGWQKPLPKTGSD